MMVINSSSVNDEFIVLPFDETLDAFQFMAFTCPLRFGQGEKLICHGSQHEHGFQQEGAKILRLIWENSMGKWATI
jgi:hypothetical protein